MAVKIAPVEAVGLPADGPLVTVLARPARRVIGPARYVLGSRSRTSDDGRNRPRRGGVELGQKDARVPDYLGGAPVGGPAEPQFAVRVERGTAMPILAKCAVRQRRRLGPRFHFRIILGQRDFPVHTDKITCSQPRFAGDVHHDVRQIQRREAGRVRALFAAFVFSGRCDGHGR